MCVCVQQHFPLHVNVMLNLTLFCDYNSASNLVMVVYAFSVVRAYACASTMAPYPDPCRMPATPFSYTHAYFGSYLAATASIETCTSRPLQPPRLRSRTTSTRRLYAIQLTVQLSHRNSCQIENASFRLHCQENGHSNGRAVRDRLARLHRRIRRDTARNHSRAARQHHSECGRRAKHPCALSRLLHACRRAVRRCAFPPPRCAAVKRCRHYCRRPVLLPKHHLFCVRWVSDSHECTICVGPRRNRTQPPRLVAIFTGRVSHVLALL